MRTAGTQTHTLHVLDARQMLHSLTDGLLFFRRTAVHEHIDGFPGHMEAGPENDQGHQEGCNGIRLHQDLVYRFRQLQLGGQPDGPHPHEDDSRRQDICRKMQGVGFQCLAPCLLGDFFKHPHPVHVDHDGNTHHDDAPDGRGHRRIAREQTACAFINDPDADNEQQHCLAQCRQVLDFAMPVRMPGIRRTGREPDGIQGHGRRQQVKPAVQCLGKDPQAVCIDTHNQLDGCKQAGRQQGDQSSPVLGLTVFLVHRHSILVFMRQSVPKPDRKPLQHSHVPVPLIPVHIPESGSGSHFPCRTKKPRTGLFCSYSQVNQLRQLPCRFSRVRRPCSSL